MSKPSREVGPGKVPYSPRGGGGTDGSMRLLLPAGLAILLVLGGFSLAEIRGIRKDMTEKLGQLDGKVAALQTKVDAVAQASRQQPRSGPDPNRVYTVKTEGSPLKGSPSAPITIAEFSDFQ